MTLYGSVEAGGTKFVCAVAEGPAAIHAMETIPTTTPEETLIRVADSRICGAIRLAMQAFDENEDRKK